MWLSCLEHFGDTHKTIPDGYGFELFSLSHIIQLLVCTLIIVLCAINIKS